MSVKVIDSFRVMAFQKGGSAVGQVVADADNDTLTVIGGAGVNFTVDENADSVILSLQSAEDIVASAVGRVEIRADDSTVRVVQGGENLGILGDGGVVSTASNAEGDITINVDTDLANYDNTNTAFISNINNESLNDLQDVTTTGVANNHLLQFDSGTGRFVTRTITAAGFSAVSTTGSYNDLSNRPNLTFDGDLSGNSGGAVAGGASTITLTLDNVNSDVGTFNSVTVNAKGQVTAASNVSYATVAFTGNYADLTGKPSLAGTYQFNIAADDSATEVINSQETIQLVGANSISTTLNDGVITITGPANLSDLSNDLTLASFTNDLTLASFTNDKGYITAADVPQTFSWRIGADDSTMRDVNAGEDVKILGAQNITTSSDAEGNITVTGPDLSAYGQTLNTAGNTGTGSVALTSETLTVLGTTGQINVDAAAFALSFSLADVINTDLKGSVFADDSTLLVDGVSGSIPSANLTGTLPALDGSSLTGVLKNVVEDTTPELGGDLVIGNNKLKYTATGDGGSQLVLAKTIYSVPNTTVFSSVGSIDLFIDSLSADTAQTAFRIFNNTDPDGTVTETNNIFKVDGNTGDVSVTGKVLLPDGSVSANYAGFGDDDDLKIFHNGGHSIVRETGTGSLYLQSNDNVILSKDSSTEIMVKGIADGAVELYHNNVKKLETTADGVSVTGTLNTHTIPGGTGTLALTSYVDTEVANIVNSAPEQLNTLNELSAALNNDGNFATTITNRFTTIENNLFSIGADDSTMRVVKQSENIKILGGTNLTTSSDAEGNITVNFVNPGFITAGLESGDNVSELTNDAGYITLSDVRFNVAADDSTVRQVNASETITFQGTGSTTVASDAEGNITIDSGNETITLFGDVTGSGTTSINVTLASSPVAPGTYNSVTVDTKGIVQSGSLIDYLVDGNNVSRLTNDAGYLTNESAINFNVVGDDSTGFNMANQGTFQFTGTNGITVTAAQNDTMPTVTIDGNAFVQTGDNVSTLVNDAGYYKQGSAMIGDLSGSVFSTDSGLVIDGQTGNLYGTLRGGLIGDVKGSVVGDDSSVIIDGVAGTVTTTALDTYAEGLHDYTITGSASGSLTTTTGFQKMSYTKIGNRCFISGKLQTANSQTLPTGDIRVSLPFACADLTDQGGQTAFPIMLYNVSGFSGGVTVHAQINEGDSFFTIVTVDANGVDSTQTFSDISDSGMEILINGHYPV